MARTGYKLIAVHDEDSDEELYAASSLAEIGEFVDLKAGVRADGGGDDGA